ncbi:MAG: sulfatase-like hydrolase/transferase [Actinomycetota bacterium]
MAADHLSLPDPDAHPDTTALDGVLFIMCDQLRWDALSCYGGIVDTPNLDRLAARGVRFDRAYVQGTTCGSSRMSYYTGRYVQTHGTRYNQVPLSVKERTLGDHLRDNDVRTVLIGKTHMRADAEGMSRLGLDPDDPRCVYLAECGFEPAERDDGLWPDERVSPDLPYNRFLRERGFDVPNPWHAVANSVVDEDGETISGWLLRSSPYAAIVPDELSESAYMVDRTIDFIRSAVDERWCVHLSFIKPHWPYVVSSPWHEHIDPADLPRAQRSQGERETDHRVLRGFQESRIGRTFSEDHVRHAVMPAYLGLVKQIDHHLGRLFAELERLGRADSTMVVLCSDHGDYLGDHWQGEKDWFHEAAVRTPMIIADPRPSADATRGTDTDALVQAIDLAPTFVEALGGALDNASPWLEGVSLMPTLEGRGVRQEQVISESDYGFLEFASLLPDTGRTRDDRATMIRTDRYKYILCENAPNLLYDLEDDPDEFVDRAGDPALASVEHDLHERLFEWFRRRAHDTTYDDPIVRRRRAYGEVARQGIVIGYWDEAALERGIAGDV